MSVVTFFNRRSTLSQMVNKSGGRTVLAALRGADKAVETLQEEGRTILLEAVCGLEAAAAASAPGPEWLDGVYAAATDVIDVCPPGLAALHKAVYSLCDLTDRQRRSGRFDRAPVEVHVASLRPLSQSDQPPEAVEAILQGLAALLARETARSGG